MPDAGLRERFLNGMSHAAATVNVVTTDGPAGRAGVTVSAMASVSADTPLPTLLVCVHHQASAAPAILGNGVFCVNVLRDDQSYISDSFAGRGRVPGADRFAVSDWSAMATGAPRVVDPLVAFDCRVVSSDLVGTHHVLFGEVGDIFVADRGSPLLYARRAYGTPTRIEGPGAAVRADRHVALGCFHSFGPFILPALIDRLRHGPDPIDLHLVEGDQRRLQESLLSGETELALLFDMDLSADLAHEALTELTPYVLLPEGHRLADRGALTPADLAGEPMVLLNTLPSRDYFPGILRAAGVEPVIAHRSTSFETVRGLVGHGLGYALLATRPASTMTYDGRALVTRPLLAEAEASRIVLATRRGAVLGPAAQEFARLCRDFFTPDA